MPPVMKGNLPSAQRSAIYAVAFPGNGVVAQLVERLVRNEKVRGSNPLGSTTPDPALPSAVPNSHSLASQNPTTSWLTAC
jgi:hypothetical protein